MSAAEGVEVIACTPHILPGVYDNSGPDIRRRVESLQSQLDAAGVECRLVVGCDAHIAPDLVSKLRSGHVLGINDSRYVLVSPLIMSFRRMSTGFFSICLQPATSQY